MGLIKNNVYIKETDETLETAYAIIRKTETDINGRGYAIIGIHRTREQAKNPLVKPLHSERVDFAVDRNGNDRQTAYKTATTPYYRKRLNYENNQLEDVLVYPYFYEWVDDIVIE